MPTLERVRKFISVVEQGRYLDALRDFYHDDASMQENGNPPRAGLAALIAHEARALERNRIRTLPVASFFADGDQVAIRWVFEIIDAEGRGYRLDEMSLQRWRGERIAEERFYYDPAQMAASNAAANRQLMEAVFEALARGNSRPFVDCLADDVRWTVTGSSKWSREFSGKRAVLGEFLGPIFEQFATRYANTATRVTAEGDRVVVECRGDVTTKAGKPYNNHYCWVCRIEGGKVKELTEYMDTALAEATLLGPLPAGEES